MRSKQFITYSLFFKTSNHCSLKIKKLSTGRLGVIVTNLVNVILEGKVPFELRPYFFGASADCPQNVPDTMSSNHVKQDMEIDK